MNRKLILEAGNGADETSANSVPWVKQGALEEIDSLKLLRSTSLEQHSHSFKWLTASLLALNGGGLLALAQSDGIAATNMLLGGSLFAIGLAFALLVAVFGQRSIMASLVPLQRQIGYWMTVAEDGIRDEKLESDLALEHKKSVRLGRFGQIAGWASAMALFAAIFVSGSGMISDRSDNPKGVEADRQTDHAAAGSPTAFPRKESAR